MSCHLVKSLRDQYKIRALPIKRGDEVKILKGKAKGKSGKVVQVYRKRNVIYITPMMGEAYTYKDFVGSLYMFSPVI